MKKNLLGFLLILCISFSTNAFAQGDAPGESGGTEGSTTADLGLTFDPNFSTATVVINPPAYILNVKRNNGNGTSSGSAETRLTFSDKQFHPVLLTGITKLNGSALPKNSVVLDGDGDFISKGYISYALNFNIPPKEKLLFHFSCNGKKFCIPEL